MTAGRADDEFRSALCSCEFKTFITDRTPQSVVAAIRASTFNRFNDAIVRTREVPLVHASLRHHHSFTYMQTVYAIAGLLAMGRLGNILRGLPSYITFLIRDHLNISCPFALARIY